MPGAVDSKPPRPPRHGRGPLAWLQQANGTSAPDQDHGRGVCLVELSGLEPLTLCLQSTPGLSATVADLGASAPVHQVSNRLCRVPLWSSLVVSSCAGRGWGKDCGGGRACSATHGLGGLLPEESKATAMSRPPWELGCAVTLAWWALAIAPTIASPNPCPLVWPTRSVPACWNG
jgi:hypothetical protein